MALRVGFGSTEKDSRSETHLPDSWNYLLLWQCCLQVPIESLLASEIKEWVERKVEEDLCGPLEMGTNREGMAKQVFCYRDWGWVWGVSCEQRKRGIKIGSYPACFLGLCRQRTPRVWTLGPPAEDGGWTKGMNGGRWGEEEDLPHMVEKGSGREQAQQD